MHARLALVILAGTLIRSPAAEPPAEEYQVKGAFLLNFAKFVQWPPEAFKGPQDAITVCILGANPFTPALERAARQVTVADRGVNVRQIPDPEKARQCQIVFVSESERKRSHALFDAVQGASVLTVGESSGFIASGGVIEFSVEDSKVRMEINAPAAKRAKLYISAKLLSLAQSGKR